MNAAKVMVVVGELEWTRQALHLACTLARKLDATIYLVKLVPVRHPLMLGTAAAYLDFTVEEESDLQDLAATIEDYNIPFLIDVCGYVNYKHALSQIADELETAYVFAPPLHSTIPLWSKIQSWQFSRALTHSGHLLLTLGATTTDWTRMATWLNETPLDLCLQYLR